jgi:UDP:flavonoid glycosyltransferase YjiC (YdhE family)
MKVLVASTPISGHVNPMFALAHILTSAGHKVVGLSGSDFSKRMEAVGAKFHAFPTGADFNFDHSDAMAPERKHMPNGPKKWLFGFERGFIDPLPAQYEGIKQVLRDFPADVILGDNMLFGVLPMLLGPRAQRPPIVLVGTSFLQWHRDDGTPRIIGLLPESNDAQRQKCAAMSKEIDPVFTVPASSYLNDSLARLGVGPMPMEVLDALVALPDAYLQLTVPSFEFPRSDTPATVQFVGTLPITPGQAPLPPWADEIDGSHKVVLVTQGTGTNYDFGQLVLPTLEALRDEPGRTSECRPNAGKVEHRRDCCILLRNRMADPSS